ncbi:MAG: histidinol dehydrogenase, partial [Planctomycetaceae bacterium]
MTHPLAIPAIDCNRDDAAADLAALRAKLSPRGDIVSDAGRKRTIELFGEPLSPRQVVERICGDVARDGLAALLDYTEKLDGKRLTADTIRVAPDEFEAAHRAADPEYLAVIRRIRDDIAEFQRATLPEDAKIIREAKGGRVELRQRCRPLRRVGICVPGGAAAYPSTLLMTAVPAQVAGVKEIAVVVPPTEFGGYNVDLLAACHELGVSEVYRIGGAQGVAALAYGISGEANRGEAGAPG